jgi:hypothetical protein
MTDFHQSEKYQQALASLPEDLRGVYEELVADYSWQTTKHFGRGYVAYAVLAELVRAGWRKSSLSTCPMQKCRPSD